MSKLPKFLWATIIDYLSYEDIIKASYVVKNFKDYVDEDKWKYVFFSRTKRIAIARTNANVNISRYWKHVIETFVSCNTIGRMIAIVEKETDSDINYKIFFKSGVYKIFTDYALKIETNNVNIKFIGSSTDGTQIVPYNYYATCKFRIINARHLLIKNMTFNNTQPVVIDSYDKQNCSVQICNCVFNTNCTIYIKSINSVIIKDSIFKCNGLFIYNAEYNTMACLISNCIFSNSKTVCSIIGQSINIALLNNIINGLGSLIYFVDNCSDTNIVADGNIISTLAYCTYTHGPDPDDEIMIDDITLTNVNISYINNYFKNCISLYNGKPPMIKSKNNECINCNLGFTKTVENAS